MYAQATGGAKGHPMNGDVPREPASPNDKRIESEGELNTDAIAKADAANEHKRGRPATPQRSPKAPENATGKGGKRKDREVFTALEAFGLVPSRRRDDQPQMRRGRKTKSGWIFTIISEALLGSKGAPLKREEKQQLVALESRLVSMVRELSASPPLSQPAEDIRQAWLILDRIRSLVFYADVLNDTYVASFILALKGVVSSALLLGMGTDFLEQSASEHHGMNAERDAPGGRLLSSVATRARNTRKRRSQRNDDPRRPELVSRMNDQLVEEILASGDTIDNHWLAPLDSKWASAPWKTPFGI